MTPKWPGVVCQTGRHSHALRGGCHGLGGSDGEQMLPGSPPSSPSWGARHHPMGHEGTVQAGVNSSSELGVLRWGEVQGSLEQVGGRREGACQHPGVVSLLAQEPGPCLESGRGGGKCHPEWTVLRTGPRSLRGHPVLLVSVLWAGVPPLLPGRGWHASREGRVHTGSKAPLRPSEWPRARIKVRGGMVASTLLRGRAGRGLR